MQNECLDGAVRRKAAGEVLFWGVAAGALALYVLTAPNGLPWQGAAASANPVWRYLVALADVMERVPPASLAASLAAALAGGLFGALANRYFGWRIGLAAALAWVTMPPVWYGAITGGPRVVAAAAVVVVLWGANALVLWVTRKARKAKADEKKVGETKVKRLNVLAGWVILGLAILFALASAATHDYAYGEAASAYARLVVEEAGERVILLNGVCDAQIERETTAAFSLRNTDENRSNLVAWVTREWPAETNLHLAAAIGPSAFAEAAVKAHPERFYTMDGQSTTSEKWAARWERMRPFLASRDPFVPAMRWAFAYEGNALGNRVQEGEGDAKGDAADRLRKAWSIYWRVFDEIHPNNPAACVNLNEMLRRGYKIDEATRQRLESALPDDAKVLADRQKAARFAAYVSHFGPVMRDQKAYEELLERVRKRLAELEKKGEKPVTIPDLKTLGEWHVEMMKAFHGRDYEKSARIARAILSRRAWRAFIPAHAMLGEKLMMEGDWVAAEAFLRVAAEATGAAQPPPLLLNDYAETLRQLKRFDEAERYARKAVEKGEEKDRWLFCLTLAQILRDGKRAPQEMDRLVKEALSQAPKDARETIRKEFPQ